LFIGTLGTGVFLSRDGGKSWEPKSAGLSDRHVYALAALDNNLLAGTGDGIFWSRDNAEHWACVSQQVKGIGTLLATKTGLYAGNSVGLFVSTDVGRTWKNTALKTCVLKIMNMGTKLFVGTNNGVFTGTIGDTTWSNAGLATGSVVSLAVSETTVFAGVERVGVFHSADSGKSWTRYEFDDVPSLEPVIHPSGNSRLGMVCLIDRPMEPVVAVMGSVAFASPWRGVCRSTDGGRNWTLPCLTFKSRILQLWAFGKTLFASTIGEGIYRSTDSGTTWKATNVGFSLQNVRTLATSGRVILAGSDAGVYRSTDHGEGWFPANTGLNTPSIRCSTRFGRRIYLGTDKGIFCSTDTGMAWRAASSGLESLRVNSLAVSGRLLLAGTDSGLFSSSTPGTRWTRLAFDGVPVSALATSGEMLVAGSGRGDIDVSHNGGKTWTRTNFIEKKPGLVNALVFSAEGLCVCTSEAGLFRSSDGGQNWNAVDTALSDQPVQCLTASETNLFAWAPPTQKHFGCILLSTDAGRTWHPVECPWRFVWTMVVFESDLLFGTAEGVKMTSLQSISSLPSRFLYREP